MKPLFKIISGSFCLALILLTSCQDLHQTELKSNTHADFEGVENWPDLLKEIIAVNSIIVPSAHSVQKAIDAANPGETIYIAPGIYEEEVQLNKQGIKLIGIGQNQQAQINSLRIDPNLQDVAVRNIKSLSQPQMDFSEYSQNARKSSPSSWFKMWRRDRIPAIAHYTFEIRLGDGPYDVVRLHRVVQEHRPYRPIRTQGEVFMIHGSSQDFDDIFYTAGAVDNVNAFTSSPVFLASRGIDVWGIDLGWTNVPLGTTDFSFMQGWGMEKDIDHALSAMSIARLIRGLTGQGFGKLNLLGFSYGGFMAYGAAGLETQQHRILRDIKGIIPVDILMKYEPTLENEPYRQAGCKNASDALDDINNKVYQDDVSLFLTIGALAANEPDQTSPFNGDFTNLQFSRLVGALPNENPSAEAWHFVGGNVNELFYTDIDRWVSLAQRLSPYQPRLTNYDAAACLCNEEDVSIDDYLSEIRVPILYIGAGGAFGSLGEYSTILTDSHDITSIEVSKTSDPATDFGHADLFMAREAPLLVWKRMADWLLDHNNNHYF